MKFGKLAADALKGLVKGGVEAFGALAQRDAMACAWRVADNVLIKKIPLSVRRGAAHCFIVVEEDAPTQTRLTTDLKFLPCGNDAGAWAAKTQCATFEDALALYERFKEQNP